MVSIGPIVEVNMQERRERVIELAFRIKAIREELPQLEAELDALLRGENVPLRNVTVRLRPPAKANMNGGSVVTPIMQFLTDHPGKAFNAAAIRKATDIAHMPSLRSALLRLTQQKKIERAGRGKYRAKAGEAMT